MADSLPACRRWIRKMWRGGYLWTEQLLDEALDEDELAFARSCWRLHGSEVTAGGWLPVDETRVGELAEKDDRAVDGLRAMEQR